MNKDYYSSERFIHDDLCGQAEKVMSTVYSIWKRNKKIDPFLLTWPSEPLTGSDGASIEGCCRLELKNIPKDQVRDTLIKALQLTKAYAALLVEERGKNLIAILESKHGTKSWTIPIQQRGDIRVLGDITSRVDIDSLGYLWSPTTAQA